MDHHSETELKEYIQKKSTDYHALPESESTFVFVMIEQQVIQAIFQYMASQGLRPGAFDLQMILDAEDDDSDGVPPEGVDATLMSLMPAIHPTGQEVHQYPLSVMALWDFFYRKFWPLCFEEN
jgi:hypothetical protein